MEKGHIAEEMGVESWRHAGGHKPVIGLVGGVGSGKTRVAAEFARHGARVIAGDPLGHQALRQPDIRERVIGRWGSGILGADGEIERRKVAAIVFHDPAERRALEAMVYPWIGERFREEIVRAQQDPSVRLVVLDAAVMLEAGWKNVCDRLVFVDAPPEVRRRRLAEQRGWSPEEVEARERSQMSLEEKARRAHHVVANAGSPEELARQVEDLLRGWETEGILPSNGPGPKVSED